MKTIARVIGGALAAALARVLVSVGRFRLVRGDALGAARAFERATRSDPSSFSAWLHLGRARLRARDLYRARRALGRAREEAPGAYDLEASEWVRLEGFDLSTLAEVAGLSGRGDPPARHPAYLGPPGAAATALLPYGDCKDLDEYARFGAMPPIAPSEFADLDWDELAEDLQDG
jgi:hypothetical protein